MRNTTLGYLYCGDDWLLLYRNKKKNDLNQAKWVGVGGKFEPGETADACFLREVKEETGFTPVSFRRVGLIHFRSDTWEDEEMYLYGSDDFTGTLTEDCLEGTLAWVSKESVMDLPLWEGDRLFLKKMLAGEPSIDMTLRYEGDRLASWSIP